MQDPLKDAKRLIHRNHLNDGLPELLIGVQLTSLGAAFWVTSIAQDSAPLRALGTILTLLFVTLCVGSVSTVKWVRTRFFIRRSGFVEYKRESTRLRVIFLAAASLLVVFTIVGMGTHILHADHWILVGMGFIFGTAQILLGKVPRLMLTGALTVVAGVVLAVASIPLERGLGLLFLFIGLLSMISGLVAFVQFLRKPAEAV